MSLRGADPKSKRQPPAKATAKMAPPPKPAAAPARNAAKRAAAAEDKKGQSVFSGHTATVDLARDPAVTPAAVGGRRIADAVMRCIGSYDKTFLLDTDGLRAHVQQVATRFIAAADGAGAPGSVYRQLAAKYPGAQISLVGTGALQPGDQLEYLVRTADNSVLKFVDQGGKPTEAPGASDAIFMAVDLSKPSAHMAVRVPEVRFLIDPTLPPSYGVGRTVGLVIDQNLATLKKNASDTVSPEFAHVYKETLPGTAKGEDGAPLGVVYSDKLEARGKIVKYNGDHTYDVQVTRPDGSTQVVTTTEEQLRSENDPMVFDLHGSQFDDVTINVDKDPRLAAFLKQAKAVSDKDIPRTGTPEQIAAGQKQALVDLNILCNKVMGYPDESPTTTDAHSKTAMALINGHSNWNPMPLGELIAAGRGVCRHQAILMQLACQGAGIASRTVAASANDRAGNFRGYHAFLETTLDDGTQYLTDPTWSDAGPKNVQGDDFSPVVNGQHEVGTPLWDTLYFNVLRQVLPTWQDNAQSEDHQAVAFNESNTPVFNADGTVATGKPPDAKSVVGGILAHLKRMSVPASASPVAKGDAYLAQGHPEHAAKAYALAISSGKDGSKATWLKLAGALSRAGLAADARAAQAFAATL